MANTDHLTDGHATRVKLVTGNIVFYEKSVTPGGTEGGDPIDITTNDNTSQKSQAPRSITSPTSTSATVSYDKADKVAAEARINVLDTVLVTYPDDTTNIRAGWLRSFIPNEMSEGEQPTAAVVFEYQGEAPA